VLKIQVFGKPNCAKCKTTKHKLEHFLSHWELDHSVQLVFHDMETVDGRAEGAFYDVNQIPLTIIEKEGREVARWDGDIPNSQSVRLVLEEGAHVSAN
jgi:thioredoxin-like negative regulator of GroEL